MNNNSLSGWLTAPIIIGVLVVGLILWAWSSYNGMVRGNIAIDTQWAQVESQYQRRVDLIPNLVGSVQGAMQQEKEVFSNLAEARSRYSGAGTTAEKIAAAPQFDSALSRLLVVMENYPQLKSVDTVQSLMAELSGTENRIATERMRFNETVQSYNILVKTFPGSLFASAFGFTARDTFAAQEGAEVAPKVDFTK